MINRIHLRCRTCGEVAAVRTAIGHGDYQEFAFPCPKCGIEIRYGMTLDQKNVSFDYTKVLNADIADMGATPAATFTFNPEILVPCNLPPDIANVYSPFVHAASLVPDMLAFKREFDRRLILLSRVWPIIKNCLVHFNNRNWTLYRQEAKALGDDLSGLDDTQLMAHCLSQLHRFSGHFRPGTEPLSLLVRQRINYVEALAQSPCQDLYQYFDGIGWIDSLFDEVCSLRHRWVDAYLIVQPVFIVFEWDTEHNDLAQYTISQKRFDDLKTFYIDVFETLCRLSVIAGGIEGVANGQNLSVPKKTGSMGIDIVASLTATRGISRRYGRSRRCLLSWRTVNYAMGSATMRHNMM